MPFYVAPEQVMKDRADYARKGIARGRGLVAAVCQEGIVLCAENPSTTLRKVSEIYDRIAFAGVGKYNEFDQLRIAGVRAADLKGFSFSREDVDARSLANQYAQILGQVFTHEMKPLEVEILVAEVGAEAADDQLFHLLYDGTVIDEDRFAVLGGDAEAVTERVQAGLGDGASDLRAARGCGRVALAGPGLRAPGRRLRGRPARAHRAAMLLPSSRGRRGGRPPDPGRLTPRQQRRHPHRRRVRRACCGPTPPATGSSHAQDPPGPRGHVLSLLVVSACGGLSGGEDRATTRPTPPRWRRPPPPRPRPTRCRSTTGPRAGSDFLRLDGTIEKVGDDISSDITPGDSEGARSAIEGLFGDVADETQSLVDSLQEGGTPDIDDGEQFVDDLSEKFQAFRIATNADSAEAAADIPDRRPHHLPERSSPSWFEDRSNINDVGDSFGEPRLLLPRPEPQKALTDNCKP
ncbi:MAG: proteasome subunit alpha [Acidimicrobiales bacterium]